MLARPLASYYLLLATVGLLVLIGLTMVFSATSLDNFVTEGSPFSSIVKQSVSAGVGLLAFWICQRLPLRTFQAIAKPALLLSFVLIVLVDVLGMLTTLQSVPDQPVTSARIGPIWADQLWLHVGPVQLQPSEFAKLAFALWAAGVLVRKGPGVAQLRELAVPLFPVAGLLFLLVGYHDLGTMLCLLAMFIGVLWAAGVRLRVFGTMIGVGLIGVLTLVVAPGKDAYRTARITVWLDFLFGNGQGVDASDEAYQTAQGLYALANGSWFGVGLGESRMKWGLLPNGHNDFIFAVIAEELGVVGCLVVLTLFGMLAYTGMRIARRVDDPYRRLVAAAITTWLISQAVINIGGVSVLLPMTGLPLPFISDGGSALIVGLAAAGILTSFARCEPDAARALHARPPRTWVRLLWAPLPPLGPARTGPPRPPRTATARTSTARTGAAGRRSGQPARTRAAERTTGG